MLGDDALKDFVLEDLSKAASTAARSSIATRPTTNKNAIVAGGYRLLKVDTLDNRSISDEIVERLAAAIARRPADAVVFSDFRHGIFNRRHHSAADRRDSRRARFRVADSQVASRWGNILEFKGFDLITPNEREARFALGDQDSVIRPLALELYDAAQCKTLILKLGERGLHHLPQLGPRVARLVLRGRQLRRPRRRCGGAGDALLAYATLAIARDRIGRDRVDPGLDGRGVSNASTTATSRSRRRTSAARSTRSSSRRTTETQATA